AGIQGVSPYALEAALGIGMTNHQQLWMVKMPLALPVIIAGVRTAAVAGVGIATLSAFIGAGGLGQFINRGLALSNNNLILLGAIPAALLALVVDFSIGALEWSLQPRRHRHLPPRLRIALRILAFLLPFLLGLGGVIAYISGGAFKTVSGITLKLNGQSHESKVIVASKNFTEQLILSELMAQLIQEKTSMTVVRRFGLGGTMICHSALVKGEIDIYAEYTGTGLTTILKKKVISDPDEVFETVGQEYLNRFNIKWLSPFGFNNTYTITVKEKDALIRRWEKISDLKGDAANLRAGFTSEFVERPDGYQGLRKTYGFKFGIVRDIDPSLMYEALAGGEVDVICAFATDGRISAYKLKPLIDDRRFFPPYYAAPVIRNEVLKTHPEIKDALAPLSGLLSNAVMQQLNYEVDGKKRSPQEVVNEFLKSCDLLKGNPYIHNENR
ncbi:MAG: glycine betaine ABC transporter substrate-binding protein, partial [Thermodesulfobacteriota bacterium]|nr:glycine betaine ABC transporter substrate-binding protein [Thermodesulfobacteriota bacterium]